MLLRVAGLARSSKTLLDNVYKRSYSKIAVPMTEVYPGTPVCSEAQSEESKLHSIQLPNGLKMINLDTCYPSTSVGLCVKFGPSFESKENRSCAAVREKLAFLPTKAVSRDDVAAAVGLCSLPPLSAAGRDSLFFSLCADRDDANLISEVIVAQTQPDTIVTQEEVEEAKKIVSFHRLMGVEIHSEAMCIENLYETAFGKDHPMGWGFDHESLERITAKDINNIQETFFVANNMTLSATGVDHTEFMDRYSGILSSIPEKGPIKIVDPTPVYKGGLSKVLDLSDQVRADNRIAANDDYRAQAHVAIAWKSFPLNTREFYVAALLDSILGSGASFSTGGPGKGMFSYLSDNVMGSYPFFHNVRALHEATFFSGLFGVFSTIKDGNQLMNATMVLIETMTEMRRFDDEIAFKRAKNILKQKICSTLELSDWLNEEMAKQLLFFGRFYPVNELADILDSITLEEVQQFCYQVLLTDPTVIFMAKEQKFLDKIPDKTYDAIATTVRS